MTDKTDCPHDEQMIDAWARDVGGRRVSGRHVCTKCNAPMDLEHEPPLVWELQDGAIIGIPLERIK